MGEFLTTSSNRARLPVLKRKHLKPLGFSALRTEVIKLILVGFLSLLVGGGIFVPSSAVAQAQQASRGIAASGKPTTKPTVTTILIQGNKKIEQDAVRAKLVSKVGEKFSSVTVREDVQALFETGYFYNVTVDKKSSGSKVTLTYILAEKPSILEIEYVGNDELDDDELAEAAGIKAYEILDMSKVAEAEEKMEKLYEDKGYFLARVSNTITQVEGGDGLKLTFSVQENDMVKVKKVTFIGNRKLASGKLKSMMATQEGGFFSFMSGAGSYKQDAFDRDMQILNYLYFNEGFVKVKIDRPQVYVSPDKKSIYITIRIEEGQQFNVGEVDFTGDLLFAQEELFEAIAIKDSELFSYEVLQKDLRSLQAKYGDLGFAFANIIPRTRVRDKDRLVDVTFEIDKGNKVYIGRINVKGNSKTRDKVVRRELRVREGELYNETRKRESMDNVRRLGFFEDVAFNTSTPGENQDRLDIDIVVKERNTGTIQVGAGYSSYQKLVFNGQVNQSNFLGKGQRLGATLDVSDKQQLFNLNFTEPYFMDSEWELGFDAYRSRRGLPGYRESKTGGAARIGHPLAPYLRGVFRYKLDDTDLELNADGDEELHPVETVNGLTSSVTGSLVYDKRNDRFAPSKGIYSSLSLEYAGLGGDLDYTKGLANFRYYKKVFWDVVWRNNLNYGFISSNTKEDPPFNELFLLGGANTLRGYEWFTIGRRKKSTVAYSAAIKGGKTTEEAEELQWQPFGGTQQLYYQTELQFPLIREAGIQGVAFYDIGMADKSFTLNEFRSDIGFGFRWFSPIGPLRFEWGFPLDRKKELNERANQFNFAIGSAF